MGIEDIKKKDNFIKNELINKGIIKITKNKWR